MSSQLAIILGDMLFKSHEPLGDEVFYFMKEDIDLCTHYKYHKHKIVFFLSAMRHHRDSLSKCIYYDITQNISFEEALLQTIQRHKITSLITYQIEDHFFKKRLEKFAKKQNISLTIVESPKFVTPIEEIKKWLNTHKPFFHSFYIYQRKRMNILLDSNKQPLGGKWSFDDENRKPLPKNHSIPYITFPQKTKYVKEVSEIVDTMFSNHPGDTQNFYLPVTHEDALQWLDEFIQTRLKEFGPYEDAINNFLPFLFHSTLTPMLNSGLLTPFQVLKAVEQEESIPLQSREGFIRQLIGWREFIRGVYHTFPIKKNYLNHTKKIPQSFYNATTQILPVDTCIKRVTTYAYTHHIERLMVLGNFMLLCEIHPDDVNTWFMEMYVDSADWVMEPNIYCMSQFANPLFATKPYISSSRYILKMSNFEKGDWCDIWDGLYWRFIDKKRDILKTNPRMKMMIAQFDKMNSQKKEYLLRRAEEFLKNLDE